MWVNKISVRFTFVAHLNGTQCLELSVPSCRVVNNQVQHVYDITVLISETLHLPLAFIFNGLTQRGEFDSVRRQVEVEDLINADVPWMSHNLQQLSEELGCK